MWLRPAENLADQVIIAQTDNNNGWSLELNGGLLTFWLSTNQGWQSDQLAIAPLQAGQWYHVAATYNGTQARTFVNGAASAGSNVGVLTQGTTLMMGGFPDYSFFNGLIDEVRLSNIVRYSGPYTVPATPFTGDANTLLLWSLDTGIGQTAVDESGNGRDGILGSTNQVEGGDPMWVSGYAFE
jgi:hypothetical protein